MVRKKKGVTSEESSHPLTKSPSRIDKTGENDREYKRKRLRNETVEIREERLKRWRECDAQMRRNETEEMREKRLKHNREYQRKRLRDETEEMRGKRKKYMREWYRNHSEEMREKRKLRNETEEIREKRLKHKRENQRKRLRNETEEMREKRLKRMRELKSKRLRDETEEMREERLKRRREHCAQIRRNETEEMREKRLKNNRDRQISKRTVKARKKRKYGKTKTSGSAPNNPLPPHEGHSSGTTPKTPRTVPRMTPETPKTRKRSHAVARHRMTLRSVSRSSLPSLPSPEGHTSNMGTPEQREMSQASICREKRICKHRSSKPVPPSPLSTSTNILEHREQASVSEIVLDQDTPDSSEVVATDSYFKHEPMQSTINAEYTDENTDVGAKNTGAEYTIVACEGGVVWDAVYSQLFRDGSVGERVLSS